MSRFCGASQLWAFHRFSIQRKLGKFKCSSANVLEKKCDQLNKKVLYLVKILLKLFHNFDINVML